MTFADGSAMELDRVALEMPSPRSPWSGFLGFYEMHYARMVGQLRAITGDVLVACEAAQEAFSRAWQDWASVRTLPDPVLWTRRHALRLATTDRRRTGGRSGARRRAEANSTEGMPPQQVRLLRALQQLPESDRRLLVLHHMAGMDIVEIAAWEQLGTDVAERRLLKARASLADLLAEDAETYRGET